MKLKVCPCCHKVQTTRNSIKIGRDIVALYFNCTTCRTTFIIRSKDWKKKLAKTTA